MKILAIETSCDDTGIAILDVLSNKEFNVLSNVVASQIKIHKKYGGVFPAMAKRAHQKNILPTFIKALEESKLLTKNIKPERINQTEIQKILEREPQLLKAIIPFLKKYKKPEIDVIAVTNGPGLEPCLWVGVNFAKVLAYYWNIPVITVNHIESHILVNFLEQPRIEFPAISLVVSGGHTQLILMKSFDKYEIIGETRDDAAGECFDKCAKILKLGYPGGPIVSKLAEKNTKTKVSLPRPMISSKDYDFSFSGLKTAVLYLDRKTEVKNKDYKIAMAKEVQQAIIDVLIKKTIKAIKDFSAKTLILGGGVSANSELRAQFKEKLEKDLPNIFLMTPQPSLSTDNGLMVAIAGYFKVKQSKFTNWQTLEANANLRVE